MEDYLNEFESNKKEVLPVIGSGCILFLFCAFTFSLVDLNIVFYTLARIGIWCCMYNFLSKIKYYFE